jgi:hypothetical protein
LLNLYFVADKRLESILLTEILIDHQMVTKIKWMKMFLSICLVMLVSHTMSQNTDSLRSAVFFNCKIGLLDQTGFVFTRNYSASGSTWKIDSFPESVVYLAELRSGNSLNPNQAYQIRIGKGGQLYSFRSATKEYVPPQWRSPGSTQPTYGGGTSFAPWMDEVWQMIGVDRTKNHPNSDSSYYIHQAGVYLKTPSQKQPFYSPLVCEHYNAEENSYTVVTWGQQADTDETLKTGYTSGILYYTKYTIVGKGILQVDNMIYNFGQDEIDHLNVPWGGIRNSSLAHFFISKPDNTYTNSPALFADGKIVQTATTGGWVAWSNDSTGNAPALGIAHSLTTNTQTNLFRYGDAPNLSLRDYKAFSMIRQPKAGQLSFGRSVSFRYFYVVGSTVDAVKNTILQEHLISNTLDTAYTPLSTAVDAVRFSFHKQGISVIVTNTPSSGLLLRAQPYLNSSPLFLITAANFSQSVTSNPYQFSRFPYDGATKNIKLLGFLDKPTILIAQEDTICKGGAYTFPDGTKKGNILSGITYISKFPATKTGWDSLIVTNIAVRTVNTQVSVIADTLKANASSSNSTFQWLNCNKNFAVIGGQTKQSYVPTTSGKYAVEVTQKGCTDTSTCYSVIVAGIVENNFGTSLSVFPNPTSGALFIELNAAYPSIQVNVFNANGELISTQQFKHLSQIHLEMKGASGYYFVELNASNKKAVVKILKE